MNGGLFSSSAKCEVTLPQHVLFPKKMMLLNG
jgi:hypothetical protein